MSGVIIFTIPSTSFTYAYEVKINESVTSFNYKSSDQADIYFGTLYNRMIYLNGVSAAGSHFIRVTVTVASHIPQNNSILYVLAVCFSLSYY